MNGSTKLAILCTVGVVGAGILGYCIYFDKKRRSHPEYKKNVLKRRNSRRSTKRSEVRVNGAVDLRDPAVREQFLTTEFENANKKLMEGNVEEAIGHFINFVQFSNNPRGSLQVLQRVLPPAIFELLVQTFALIAQENNKGGANNGVAGAGGEQAIEVD